MAKQSAGILLYRERAGAPEVLLVHPGGPFWAKTDLGVWSIPKGEYEEGEDPRACAMREFEEELGVPPPTLASSDLGSTRQAGGKIVRAWAGEGDLDPTGMRSNTFTSSGHRALASCASSPRSTAPSGSRSVKRTARINPAQAVFLERLRELLGGKDAP